MAIPITNLQGCTDLMAARLAETGIFDSRNLLKAAATSDKRAALAMDTELDPELILKLARRADLSRVRGVAGVYAHLLDAAGVRSLHDLLRQDAETLWKGVLAANEEFGVTATPPTQKQVAAWIAGARDIAPLVKDDS
ncbi:MAG: DUF4332 domain-containing protein [Pseudomonadota bacterium]